MKSITHRTARIKYGLRFGAIATVAMIATGTSIVLAQEKAGGDEAVQGGTEQASLIHDTGAPLERISASHLYEKCVLIGSFSEESLPENYDDVALTQGWSDILKTFNTEDVQFLVLCFGNQPNRAHVWLESPLKDGDFVASGPQFPPNWTIGEDGALCLGTMGDLSCASLYKHHDSGFLYLSDLPSQEEEAEGQDETGGQYWVVIQDEDNNPIYGDIERYLDGFAAE